jgi:hypothetical protein
VFLLERTLEIELRAKKIEVSPDKIREAVSELELMQHTLYSEVKIEGKRFIMRSKVEGLAN